MLYPIGIQNFEKIRKEGYVYIDKTASIYDLVSSGTYYFLSRPRRFGKSLLVSTLESYFRGRKELFEGLALERLEKEWAEYPVLHLDFSGSDYLKAEDLDITLNQCLGNWENEFGIDQRFNKHSARFKDLIDGIYRKTGKKIVILIDEYDKPIIDNILNPELSDYFKQTLQGFYSVLKAKDGQIRFGFLTGVTRIGKMSVFSALNNLIDISLDADYADICGISEKDLGIYFTESISELALTNAMTEEDCFDKLRDMYDGYHFSENVPGMYNPFSLLNTFRSKQFRDYWFETGTPTLLVNVMKQTSFDVTSLSDNIVVSSYELNGMADIVNKPVSLFFQTGYLTIKDYNPEFREYRLGFPNSEVKSGFLNFIYSYYVPVNPAEGNTTTGKLAQALRDGNPELFMRILESLFANTTYQIQGNAERDFQYAMYIIMELLGEYVQAERSTSNGRIDLLFQTRDYIYIIELKIDSSAESALSQIDEKGYAKPFSNDSRKIFRIGVNFSTSNRRIEDWKILS